MGWPIFGSEKTVSAFSRDDLKSYMGANYRAGGMMLIAAGAVDHAQLVDAAGSLFQRLALGDGPAATPARFFSGEIRDEQRSRAGAFGVRVSRASPARIPMR